MRYNDNVFTIYHLMERAGMFASNPANLNAVDLQTKQSIFKGPVEYPKMLYSPKGETRVTEPGQVVQDEFGKPHRVGRQIELINKIVETPEEEAGLKKLGWLDHPAKSIRAGGGEAPPISSAEQVESLEAQLEDLRKRLEEAEANMGPSKPRTALEEAENALSAAAGKTRAA